VNRSAYFLIRSRAAASAASLLSVATCSRRWPRPIARSCPATRCDRRPRTSGLCDVAEPCKQDRAQEDMAPPPRRVNSPSRRPRLRSAAAASAADAAWEMRQR
jgi:hypothetical protein